MYHNKYAMQLGTCKFMCKCPTHLPNVTRINICNLNGVNSNATIHDSRQISRLNNSAEEYEFLANVCKKHTAL